MFALCGQTGRKMKHLYINSVIATLLGLGGVATPAWAEEAAQPSMIVKGPLAAAGDTVSPLQFKLTYTGEAWDLSGGNRSGGNYMQGLDASLSIDADKLGWRGAHFYFEAFGVTGKSLFDQAGAFSAPSAIDGFLAMNTFRLYQAFYEQRLYRTDVLLGIYDPQTQFAATRPMDVFFNRAFAWSAPLTTAGNQAGLNLPLYPNSELGLRIKHEITDQLTAKFGLLNAQADNPTPPWNTDVVFNSKYGAFAIGELDYMPMARTKIMAGYWALTGKFTSLDRLNADGAPHQYYGTSGGYFGGATRVYTIEGGRGVDVFANFGFANADVNVVDKSVSGGMTVMGPFEARPHDKLGLAIGYSHISQQSAFKAYNYELPIELTYRAQLTDWLTVQPNIQYILHPALVASKKNDFLIGLHFEIGHLFNL